MDLPNWLNDLTERFNYLGPFVVLVLCGVGLPLPEEVTLIAAGLMLYQDKVEFIPITLVCSLAILIGDSLPYWVGKRYGPRALENRWVSKILHPERFALVEQKFEKHGSWLIFTCRFLPGIRIPAYFTAGTLGMGYFRFLVLDTLGVMISVPTSIWIAMKFGGQVEKLESQMENFHLVVSFALVAVLLIVLLRMNHRRRDRQANAMHQGTEGPENARSDSDG
ncbi:MAG: membrane protein DedA with SNARE-associated domain [Planctomycetota bacterium]|jgi:membrane protein DedA with SNARE-associated domain